MPVEQQGRGDLGERLTRALRAHARNGVAVIGVDGPLRWGDLQVGGAAMPGERSIDDVVEFVLPLTSF